MKSSHITHFVWGIGAVAAFALGTQFARRETARAAAARLGLAGLSAAGGAAADGEGAVNRPLKPAVASAADAAHGALAGGPLTPRQIEELAKDAFTDPNPLTRNTAFSKLLASLTPENVKSVLESMKANRAGGEQWGLFLYAWGSVDPAGALAHAGTLEGGAKTRFLDQTIPGWASKDPKSAIAWLDAMKEGDEKNHFRSSIVGGLADHDIGMATEYVMERMRAGDKGAEDFLQTVAGEALRKNGPAGAAAWGEGLPDGPLKGSALDQIAAAYTRQNPAAAAEWAAKYATVDYGARIIEEVGDNWAERDPKAALNWLGTLQEGAGRAEGTYSALREWTRRDAVAASEYLAALPESPSKDSAVSGFARSLAWEDPESAITWATTITNEDSRVKTLTRAGQSWFRRDPAAATRWVQSSNLPPAAREAILNPPKDERGRRG